MVLQTGEFWRPYLVNSDVLMLELADGIDSLRPLHGEPTVDGQSVFGRMYEGAVGHMMVDEVKRIVNRRPWMFVDPISRKRNDDRGHIVVRIPRR
jgi:hypothetical protein